MKKKVVKKDSEKSVKKSGKKPEKISLQDAKKIRGGRSEGGGGYEWYDG